jgi:hypothetical protein
MMSSYDSPFRPIILSCSAVEVWILIDVYFSSAMCIYNYRSYATYGVFMFLPHYQGFIEACTRENEATVKKESVCGVKFTSRNLNIDQRLEPFGLRQTPTDPSKRALGLFSSSAKSSRAQKRR